MSNYANALKSLDTILKSYDARNLPRPQSGNGNVTVETNFYLRDILEVDERNSVRLMLSSEVLMTFLIPDRTVLGICVKNRFFQEFTVQMTFRQKWLDKRLAFDSSKRYNVSIFSNALH